MTTGILKTSLRAVVTIFCALLCASVYSGRTQAGQETRTPTPSIIGGNSGSTSQPTRIVRVFDTVRKTWVDISYDVYSKDKEDSSKPQRYFGYQEYLDMKRS